MNLSWKSSHDWEEFLFTYCLTGRVDVGNAIFFYNPLVGTLIWHRTRTTPKLNASDTPL